MYNVRGPHSAKELKAVVLHVGAPPSTYMVLPTIKDIKNHINGFKKDRVIGETAFNFS